MDPTNRFPRFCWGYIADDKLVEQRYNGVELGVGNQGNMMDIWGIPSFTVERYCFIIHGKHILAMVFHGTFLHHILFVTFVMRKLQLTIHY